MSKAVRIRDHLYAEIELLAKQERRSLISQLEVLLEQALKMDGSLSERGAVVRPSYLTEAALHRATGSQEPRSESDHFKPDFK